MPTTNVVLLLLGCLSASRLDWNLKELGTSAAPSAAECAWEAGMETKGLGGEDMGPWPVNKGAGAADKGVVLGPSKD